MEPQEKIKGQSLWQWFFGADERNVFKSIFNKKNKLNQKYQIYPFHIKKAKIIQYEILKTMYHLPFLSMYTLLMVFISNHSFNGAFNKVGYFLYGNNSVWMPQGFFEWGAAVFSYPVLHISAWLTTKTPFHIGTGLKWCYRSPSYLIYGILFWWIYLIYTKKHHKKIGKCFKCNNEQIINNLAVNEYINKYDKINKEREGKN